MVGYLIVNSVSAVSFPSKNSSSTPLVICSPLSLTVVVHVWYFCVQEDSDLLGLRLFVDEQSRLLKDFSEHLEQSVTTLKQDVAAIVRRKRERSGIWSWRINTRLWRSSSKIGYDVV